LLNALTCRSSSATEPSAQECLQLVVRATQVFREEYIQKFEQAREEIARRYYRLIGIYLCCQFDVAVITVLAVKLLNFMRFCRVRLNFYQEFLSKHSMSNHNLVCFAVYSFVTVVVSIKIA